MQWKRLLIKLATWKKYHNFITDTRYPEKAKNRLWQKETRPLIQNSSFWQQRVQVNSESKLEEFDITTYADYEKLLLSALNSTIQPFNGEPIIFWSETSATTGNRKYFPITTSFQKQFQRTMGPFFYSLIKRFPGFFDHKVLYLAAYRVEEESPAGTPMGLISHFNYHKLPALIKSFYALPIEVFNDAASFHQWAPLYALATDLSAIFAITPMAIESFYKLCAENFIMYRPYLLENKPVPSHLPPIHISKERQTYLQNLDSQQTLSFNTLWPSLGLAGTWISGPCEHFAQQLASQMGEKITLIDGTYSATEGWMTVPIETGQLGGILHPGTHIVEFIEEGKEIVKENLISCWELEVGKRYEVFLTTAMGFVRYQLKDIVKCTGFLNRAPRIEFCYKSAQLRLDYCAISEQELRCMLTQVDFKMESYWFFARDSLGNKLFLVTDTPLIRSKTMLKKMHEILIENSETYAYGVKIGAILPIEWCQLSKEQLLKNTHAQTKPKLISQEIIQTIN